MLYSPSKHYWKRVSFVIKRQIALSSLLYLLNDDRHIVTHVAVGIVPDKNGYGYESALFL
jgi:hypothetical protein